MNRQRFLLPALIALTVARLVLLPLIDLTEVEQHVAASSQREGLWQPALGPILPKLVKISTAVFGVNAFGIRFFAPLLILGSGWLIWKMTRGMFDATTASWTLVIFHVTPAVNVASVTMTLTTVGIASSVGLLWCLRHALHRENPWHLQWWTLAGALVLTIFVDWRLFMLAASCIAGLALTQRGRRAMMKWPVLPVLGLSVGLALTFFVAWNSEHDWPAFAPFPSPGPPTLGLLTWHVLLGISPLLLAGYGWALVESVVRKPMEYAVALLYAFAWPLVTLDVLSWMVLPFPHCGFGAWIAPSAILLAYLALHWVKAPTRTVILMRWIALFLAAAQSAWVIHRMISGPIVFAPSP